MLIIATTKQILAGLRLISPYSQLFIIVSIGLLSDCDFFDKLLQLERNPNGLKQNDSQDREIMNTKKMRYVWFPVISVFSVWPCF